MKLGDVSPLIGRHFVATSGNVGRTMKLGPGGIGVSWRDDPTVRDAKEYDAWAITILGPNFESYSEINLDLAESRAAYRKWLSGGAK